MAIQKLNIHNIIIIGGTGVISLSVENQLASLGIETNRISGKDRYETNINVSYQLDNVSEIAIVTGDDFADGLSGSALAGSNCNPIFLVGENSLLQKDYLDKNSITNYNIIALGGTVSKMAIDGLESSNIDYEEKKISDVNNVKLDDITKIVFYDGRGGLNKPLTIEDKQKIKEFTKYLDGDSIKKIKNPNPPSGWAHCAEFYINNKKVMDITFSNPLKTNNNNYYDVIKGKLDANTIDKFLKSIDSSWNTTN
ncbi:cell wall-binding repeat-containing protein [Clostridium sp. P21]|uniref:Cell wall-binding repeat-containing protein n=1 Tax=Clostridium muellerianum TaxID=2716538 RepID=A0A7Y0EGQ6_9CLOT|nr:cell wall-binding repeat-containing protein [Clostridium muellerianum]NMM63113.1 cell wall-binding repeat-containing protein [Clostridium muellerianum]